MSKHTQGIFGLGKVYVAISCNTSSLVSGSYNKCIKVWDVETGECIKTLRKHAKHVESTTITSDGSKLVSGSWNKSVEVGSLRTGECLHTLHRHRDDVKCVAISHDDSDISLYRSSWVSTT